MLAFLTLKYSKSVQVFINDLLVLRYVHDIPISRQYLTRNWKRSLICGQFQDMFLMI